MSLFLGEKNLHTLKDYQDLVDRGVLSQIKARALSKVMPDFDTFVDVVLAQPHKMGNDLSNVVKQEAVNQLKASLFQKESLTLKKALTGKLIRSDKSILEGTGLESHLQSANQWETIVIQIYHKIKGIGDEDIWILNMGELDQEEESHFLEKIKNIFKGKKILLIGTNIGSEYFFRLGAEPFCVTIESRRDPRFLLGHTEKENKWLDDHFLGNTDVRKLIDPSENEEDGIKKFREKISKDKMDVIISFQVFNHLYFSDSEARQVIKQLRTLFLKPDGVEFHDRSF